MSATTGDGVDGERGGVVFAAGDGGSGVEVGGVEGEVRTTAGRLGRGGTGRGSVGCGRGGGAG